MFAYDEVEAFMRSALIGCLSGLAVLSGVSLAAAATPIPPDTQTAADFLLATCQGSADNLDSVAALAEQQKWVSMIDPAIPQPGPLKVNGTWRVSQNGQSYIVVTGTGPLGKTSCQVMFNDPKPSRDGFMAAIAHALTLKTNLDQAMPDMRQEMYQIVNLAPSNAVLQIASRPTGVFEASIIGPDHR